MALSAASFAVLNAPAHWRSVDFISDLHLQASEPATFTLWQRYMTTTAADAVFILGDLFEVWVGDDTVARQAFLQDCAGILKQSAAHTHVAFMHGNRDFLVGPDFLQSCQVNALQDPTVLCFAGKAQHGGVLQRIDLAGLQKIRADQKITVAVHESHMRMRCRLFQYASAVLQKSLAGNGVIAHPDFKQITQDEHGIGRRCGHVALPQSKCGGLAGLQM